MKLLIDANIILEVLVQQERTRDAKLLLEKTDEHEMYMTDFAIHSVGISVFTRKHRDLFAQFLADMILGGILQMVRLDTHDMASLANVAERFALDFDDAYQYAAAEKYDLTIVSFDDDFDRTERKRKTPAEALGS